MATVLENLKEIQKRVPVVNTVPPGYVSVKEFADRIDGPKQVIIRAIRSGRISHQHLVLYSGGRGGLRIRWNTCVYDYLMSRPEKFRPKDFAENPERQYKPIEVPEAANELFSGSAEFDPLTDDEMKYRPVEDITSAKFREAQIKIENATVALTLAKNRAVLVADVVGTQRQIAAELKASLKSFIQRVSPKVAAESSVVECRLLLEKMLADSLNVIAEFEGGEDAQETN